jgi:hypothetical protein
VRSLRHAFGHRHRRGTLKDTPLGDLATTVVEAALEESGVELRASAAWRWAT